MVDCPDRRDSDHDSNNSFGIKRSLSSGLRFIKKIELESDLKKHHISKELLFHILKLHFTKRLIIYIKKLIIFQYKYIVFKINLQNTYKNPGK